MIGAIAGDIAGSVYEWANIKTKDFPLFTDRCFFTDDSILLNPTIAGATAQPCESAPLATPLTYRLRERCRKPYGHSWTRPMSKTPFGRRSHLEATRTRSPALRAESPKPSTETSRIRYRRRFTGCLTSGSGLSHCGLWRSTASSAAKRLPSMRASPRVKTAPVLRWGRQQRNVRERDRV